MRIRWMMYVGWLVVVSILLCVSEAFAQPPQLPVREDMRVAYMELLAAFPVESQGKGLDPEGLVDHQPMTYGLVLWAESLRYRACPTEEGQRRVRLAARWLVENRDLDNDGKPGWGLPQAWDAGATGTMNPRHTPYTITTGVCLLGLAEADVIPGMWKPDEREQFRTLMRDVHLRWCREMWLEGYGSGYFRYSPTASNDIFSVNAPAMYLAALANYLHVHGQSLSAADVVIMESRRDCFVKTIVATVTLRDGLPSWEYMAMPNRFNQSRPNDLLHHIYTLWGAEIYRDLNGSVPLPWTREQMLESVEKFWKNGQICMYPFDELRISKVGNREYPSILWGTGSLLQCYGKWGTEPQTVRSLETIRRLYGPWPQLKLYPPSYGAPNHKDDPQFYPRHAAHILLGLAYATYGPHLNPP